MPDHRDTPRHPHRSEVGMTLVEAMLAMGVLAIALTGTTQLLLLGTRTNHFSERMAAAGIAANDLLENMALWPYDDPRLHPLEVVSAPDASSLDVAMDFGRTEEVVGGTRPHYGEPNDDFPLHPASLSTPDRPYRGMDGVGAEPSQRLHRYWNVYAVDPDGDGIEDGKLVMVAVRWREPGLGYRQVTLSSFFSNQRAMAQ